jgi:hypothetical protein
MKRVAWLLPLILVAVCTAQNSKNNATKKSVGIFRGIPYQVGKISTPTSTTPEAEEANAIDPNDSSNLAAVISDYSLRNIQEATTKFAVTNNAGATWSQSFIPLAGVNPTTSDGVQWLDNRDPAIAIDKLGNVFVAGVYELLASGSKSSSKESGVSRPHPPAGIYVCQGVLPSVVLTSSSCRPVFTNTTSPNPFSEDKPCIVTDNSQTATAGNVYAAWLHFVGCQGSTCQTKFIVFSHSTDHGVTWSNMLQVSKQNQDVEWPQAMVGNDGTIYVSWQTITNGNLAQHWLATSTNGGLTFTTPQAITPVYQDLVFNTTYRKNSGPNVVISSVAGAEYVYDVFAQQKGFGSQVVFVRSNLPKGQGGFTSPVAMNDSQSGQRLFPAAAVDNNGTLHVAWFDTRNSPIVSMYDIYATYSTDLGSTFAPNARVTPALIRAGSFIGDFAGIVAEPTSGVAHPVWTNGGLNNGKLQTTTLTVP